MAELSYRMVLPPGWARIPLSRADGDFRALIERAMEKTPSQHAVAVRSFLESQIAMALEAAREQAIAEFILPLEPVRGVPIPASITVTAITPPASETRSPQEILVAMAGRGDAQAIELDGLVGIRRSRTVGASSGAPVSAEAPLHKSIAYICHLPWSNEWLTFTASIVSSDDPEIADQLLAVEALIDTMISTVRLDGGTQSRNEGTL